MTDYLTDGAHVFVTGATGAGDRFGGKTVLMHWWVREAVQRGWHDLGVIVNPKDHAFIGGKRVTNLEQFATAYRSGERVINFAPRNPAEDHDRLMRTLRQLPGEKIVGHDEAHEVADSEMLDWMFRQGGNIADSRRFDSGNIRNIAASQHPWDLPEGVSNNVPLFVFIGPKTPQSKRYFDVMQISESYEMIPDNVDPYHWSVINAGTYVETNAPVPEDYAP